MNKVETVMIQGDAPPASGASAGAAAAVGLLCLTVGAGLAVAGTYLLAGTGWALVAGSVPFMAIGAMVIRGMSRVS
jgi:hypothetical protein